MSAQLFHALLTAIMLPFHPTRWRKATRFHWTALLGAVLVWSLLAHGGLGIFRVFEMGQEARLWSANFDRHYDSIIIDDQGVRVEGTRLLRVDATDSTLLVDPNETISSSAIHTEQYLVIRRHHVEVKRRFQGVEYFSVSDILDFIGGGPIEIRSSTLSSFWNSWGWVCQLSLLVLMVGVMIPVDLAVLSASAAVAGAVLLGVKGRSLGLTYAGCFQLALAVAPFWILLTLFLNILGTGPGCCGTVFLPVPLLLFLGWLALVMRRNSAAADQPQ